MVKKDRLRRQAQRVLFVKDLAPNKQHRTCWCSRHATTEGAMPIYRSLTGNSARVAKIKTCGSVWACPVCSAKVAHKRQAELAYAMAKHIEPGGNAYLVTLTFPHYIGQTLAELEAKFKKARQAFQNSRAWKKVMDVENTETGKPAGTAGRVGSVNSTEVTYGTSNGWHPHLHILVFCGPDAFREGEALEDGRLQSPAIEFFRGEWVRQLERAGLVDGSNRTWAEKYALDVRGGKKAAEYVAKWGHDEKWGLSSELTQSHSKIGMRDTWGANDHYTPFQLLAMSEAGDGHATCAFREFVTEFEGKRMLTWSRGLKKHFGIAEMEDEQAAEQEELGLIDEHQCGELQPEQLQVLVKWGRFGEFLSFVAEFGYLEQPQQMIDDWIANCGGGRESSGAILMDRMVVTNYDTYFHRPELIE
jgi:hypothetical protein